MIAYLRTHWFPLSVVLALLLIAWGFGAHNRAVRIVGEGYLVAVAIVFALLVLSMWLILSRMGD